MCLASIYGWKNNSTEQLKSFELNREAFYDIDQGIDGIKYR